MFPERYGEEVYIDGIDLVISPGSCEDCFFTNKCGIDQPVIDDCFVTSVFQCFKTKEEYDKITVEENYYD
jgi:hypothetical protein